jgi:hypothetical protein
MTVKTKKVLSREEALSVARGLVQEAVDVAGKAGIAPSSILTPHCSEIAVKDDSKDDSVGDGDSKTLNWCDIPVEIDNSTEGLFEMPELNDDLEQKPAFLVTQATADFVLQDFERYKPSLERMAEDWREEKSQFMREQAGKQREDKKSAKRSGVPRRN